MTVQNMQTTASRLKWLFSSTIALSLLVVVAFESQILTEGFLAGRPAVEYICLVVLEVLTLIVVPLSLRLFRFAWVRRRLCEGGARAMLSWGSLRIASLGGFMLVNLVCYYLFVNPSFGYLAIILLLSMLFVYPSLERCVSDTTPTKKD